MSITFENKYVIELGLVKVWGILYSGTFRSVAGYSLPFFLRPCRGLMFRSKRIVDRAVVFELSIRVAACQYSSQDCAVRINVQISGSCEQECTSRVGNPRGLTFSQTFSRPQMLLLPIFLLYGRFTYSCAVCTTSTRNMPSRSDSTHVRTHPHLHKKTGPWDQKVRFIVIHSESEQW
jgi:hypothetical protein